MKLEVGIYSEKIFCRLFAEQYGCEAMFLEGMPYNEVSVVRVPITPKITAKMFRPEAQPMHMFIDYDTYELVIEKCFVDWYCGNIAMERCIRIVHIAKNKEDK